MIAAFAAPELMAGSGFRSARLKSKIVLFDTDNRMKFFQAGEAFGIERFKTVAQSSWRHHLHTKGQSGCMVGVITGAGDIGVLLQLM